MANPRLQASYRMFNLMKEYSGKMSEIIKEVQEARELEPSDVKSRKATKPKQKKSVVPVVDWTLAELRSFPDVYKQNGENVDLTAKAMGKTSNLVSQLVKSHKLAGYPMDYLKTAKLGSSTSSSASSTAPSSSASSTAASPTSKKSSSTPKKAEAKKDKEPTPKKTPKKVEVAPEVSESEPEVDGDGDGDVDVDEDDVDADGSEDSS
eukprot:TRINITY_DN1993_c0_g1_i2.p2 TRINITY_DN1993_c0_g1~~TRINITY_DN1993_c0_g1_i2.p2  ORF type:complete len:207 (-),score=82.46 TRINITY_DN1993_c0_g1_i2:1422-2042(-)